MYFLSIQSCSDTVILFLCSVHGGAAAGPSPDAWTFLCSAFIVQFNAAPFNSTQCR